jgi:hypothetical protein
MAPPSALLWRSLNSQLPIATCNGHQTDRDLTSDIGVRFRSDCGPDSDSDSASSASLAPRAKGKGGRAPDRPRSHDGGGGEVRLQLPIRLGVVVVFDKGEALKEAEETGIDGTNILIRAASILTLASNLRFFVWRTHC